VPNQSHSGWQGRPWTCCDRCGLDYHADQLQLQRGLKLCPECLDNPIAFERDRIIAEVLESREEEAGPVHVEGQDASGEEGY
jgi:hypothetical protein